MTHHKRIKAALFAAVFSITMLTSNAYAAEENVLNVYNWIDYIALDTIANFEKETGIKVRYQTYEDNETLDATLRNKNADYDVVVPSSDWAKAQIDNELFLKLNKAKLPNLKNLDTDFTDRLKNSDPKNAYLVAYLWGYTTLGVNVDKVLKALGKTPLPKNLWELAFNPVYTKKLKSCGIAFLDSPGDIMPIALHYIGKPPFSTNATDYTAAAEALNKVRPDIKYISSSGQADRFADESVCIAIGWGADFSRARKISKDKGKSLNIAPVFPEKSGLLFLDSMAIPKNAKHPDNAHKFINYILRAEVHAKITNETKYANPNKASTKFVDIAMMNDRSLILPKQDFSRLIAPEALDENIQLAREKAFERFKASK